MSSTDPSTGRSHIQEDRTQDVGSPNSSSTSPAPPRQGVRLLRAYRKLHRKAGAALCAFFLIISLTGLLLGWKKHTGGIILPKTSKGVSADLSTWLPFDSLHQVALRTLRDSISTEFSPELERIDARPQKGSVKFVFLKHYWEVQLDGTTGEVLQISRRTSDIIENIHDGSIFDFWLDTDDEQFKLVYTTVMGVSLAGLSVTGFWLWYGPKRIRRKQRGAAV